MGTAGEEWKGKNVGVANRFLRKEVARLTAERDRLKAALEKYGRHHVDCLHGPTFFGGTEKWTGCTCGFEALSPATPTDTKGDTDGHGH